VKGVSTYYKTVKVPTDVKGLNKEFETTISKKKYEELLKNVDPYTNPIVKTRYCFVHKGQHFELDHFKTPVDLWMLEAELDHSDQEVKLPKFLGELVEVTGDPNYNNSVLSQKN
jgi:CYTH domain-containing protein